MFFRKSSPTKALAAVQNAEALWQATEGAAMQKTIAADLLSSVSAAIRNHRRQSPLQYNLQQERYDLKNIGLQETAKWRRRHCIASSEFQSFKYHVVVDLHATRMALGPISIRIEESLAVYDLMVGKAAIHIHHPSSPFYTSGHANWDQHKETCAFYAASIPEVDIYREKVS